jgi:hypothetical protein
VLPTPAITASGASLDLGGIVVITDRRPHAEGRADAAEVPAP